MKKNQLTALKNKYYSNWGLLSKMKVGMAFMLLGTSPVVMANADKSNSDSVYEINQQTGLTLKGVVKDVKNEPLIGVNVLIKGTTTGAITDLDGAFTLNVKKGDILVISYTGYETQEVVVKDNSPLNIVLKENLTELNEVVVTALGIKKETKALTYNVQEIKAAELVTVKDANFMNALSGKIAGVTINSTSSGVGGGARVVMRGTKSISGNNNALYVVDGIPLPNLSSTQPSDLYTGMGQSGDGIATLNPDDIESISVLTGAAAAALYGSDAANGVVMITTKKGEVGKLSVSVSNSTTFSSPFVLPEFQNTYGSETGEYASWGQKLVTPTSYDPADFFQTGFNVNNSISLSTGTETNQTYFSASTVNARGIVHNNDFERYNFSVRNSSDMLNNRLHMDLSFMYMRINEQNMLSQGQYFNPLVPIYLFPRGDDIAKYQTFERYNASRNFKTQYWPYGDQGMMMQNPYWITERDKFNNNKDRFLTGLGLKFDITDWMNISARLKYDGTKETRTKKYNASTAALFAGSDMGAYYKDEVSTTQIYADAMLNVDKYIGDFSLKATLGTSIRDMQYNYSSLGGPLQSTANLFTYGNLNKNSIRLAQNGYHDQTQAIFATIQAGYKSMVYVDVTGRNDWASQLANSPESSFFYPSVGLSAVVTEMVKLPRWISFLKLRGSYAEVGSPLPQYLSSATYQFNSSTGYYETYTRFVPDKLYPEMTRSWEVGMDLRLWQERLTLDITYYKSNTNKQTFQIPISGSSGYSSMVVQSGCVQNKGVEAVLGVKLRSGDFSYNASFAYTLNRNKIKSMVPYYTTLDGQVGSLNQITKSNIDGGAASFLLREGGTMGDLWTKNVIKKDEDGNYLVNAGGKLEIAALSQKVGSVLPKYTLSMNNDFRYKGFRAGFQLHARVGGKVLSATQAYLDGYGVSKASAAARDNGGVPVNQGKVDAETWYTTIGTGKVYSHYIYNATNIRLQEASIGYTLPKRWFRDVCSIDISLVGRNLWLIYCKAPFDPESASSTDTYYQGIDFFMQPSLRSYGFSVKLNF